MLDKLFNLYIGRVVVALSVILLPFAAAFANWVQDVLGVDIPKDDLAFVMIAFILGFAALVYKWLSNRGSYERVVLELEKLYEAGKDVIEDAGGIPDPTPPQAAAKPQDIPRRP